LEKKIFFPFLHESLMIMQMLILLRNPDEPVTAENIDKLVQCELLRGSPSENMLRVLQVKLSFLISSKLLYPTPTYPRTRSKNKTLQEGLKTGIKYQVSAYFSFLLL
jgi:hypothetical protein